MLYTEIEQNSARQRLESRPEAFIGLDSDNQEAADLRTRLENQPFRPDSDDTGTAAPIQWDNEFTFITPFEIKPKDIQSDNNLVLNLYSKPNTNMPFQSYYGLFDTNINSRAKLLISAHPASDSLSICSINNTMTPNYRCGSALVQIAIERSLIEGFDGCVSLISTRASGQFYFKLGFLPKSRETYEALLRGENIDGGEMYLPQASIEAWKTKIRANPMFPESLEYLEDLRKLNIFTDEDLHLHKMAMASKAVLNNRPKLIYHLIQNNELCPHPELVDYRALLNAAFYRENHSMLDKIILLRKKLFSSRLNDKNNYRAKWISGIMGLSIATLLFPYSLTLASSIGILSMLTSYAVQRYRESYLESLLRDPTEGSFVTINDDKKEAYDIGQKATTWLGYFNFCTSPTAWRNPQSSYQGLVDSERDCIQSEIDEERRLSFDV